VGAHRVRDIAEQSGLSEATVDRVLHRRAGVSARAVRAVEQAMHELDRQQAQLRLGARTLLLDVVMQAPVRFSTVVREALEGELAAARPATVRARFHLRESGTATDLAEVLDSLGRHGRSSQGVLLKAPDQPEVAAAVGRLRERGIPVVTLVTDVHDCPRVSYVGLDNAAAGATAAYLMGEWLQAPTAAGGAVLVTLSRSEFFGERERADSFHESLGGLRSDLRVVEVTDADGLDAAMAELVRSALVEHRVVRGVYSVGGGNRAIAAELVRTGADDVVFLGHDLDADNVALLRAGTLRAVLHHDLRADMRAAVRQVLRFHRLVPGAPASVLAAPQVVTPYNLPARLGPS
jgi:LacI family transcriptional regulator